jgi:hypothetical protein
MVTQGIYAQCSKRQQTARRKQRYSQGKLCILRPSFIYVRDSRVVLQP